MQIDPARLAAYGLSMEDVRTAIAAANVNGAKGGFDGRAQAFAWHQRPAADAGRLPQPGDRYRDAGAACACATWAPWSRAWRTTRVVRAGNGQPAVLLDVQRQPGANIVQTVRHPCAPLPELERALPPGVQLAVVTDRTETIRASVADVQLTLLLAIVLVVAVIFLFLRIVARHRHPRPWRCRSA